MGRNRGGGEGTNRALQILVGLGFLFVLLVVAEWAAFEAMNPGEDYTRDYALTLLFNGVPALGISYGGYRLRRSDIEADQYRRILAWCLGAMTAFLSLNLVIMALWPADSLAMNVGWARGSAIYAACGGFIMGIIEARAVKRARVAEREIARTEHVEAQRQWLGYMNSLLRHEVLNTANVIEGYAELLIEEDPGDLSEERLETIRRQSRNLSEVINDVRVLIDATEEVDDFEAVNLSKVLTDRVVELRTVDGEVIVDADVPDGVYVTADQLLPRVFSNLLNNAVEHNDSDVPRVSVSVETGDDTVAVSISDNGPGIPAEKRDTLFEGDTRTSNHGLGLYLVRTLAERYEGTAELRGTGPDGSTFVVELPRARNPLREGAGEADSSGPADRLRVVKEVYGSG